MKTVVIVQARMGSTRLPGKVLMDLGGATVLERVVSRLRRAKLADEIVVATTVLKKDDALRLECERIRVLYFRGSESDVLDRFYRCADFLSASAVVRITADCPLIDPELVDAAIQAFRDQPCHYASNSLTMTYPRGLDIEIFTMSALQRAWSEADKPYQREHVTPFLYEHPELFHLLSLTADADYSQYRWTLDTAEDLDLLRVIYSRFNNHDQFGWREVLRLIEREPRLAQLNAHVLQKAVHA
jgi:spore coat polysaccharide biosynthesis protein SpsF